MFDPQFGVPGTPGPGRSQNRQPVPPRVCQCCIGNLFTPFQMPRKSTAIS